MIADSYIIVRAFIVKVSHLTVIVIVIAAHSSEYVMQLQFFLSHLNEVWVGGMRIQIGEKTRKSAIELIFRGVWAREIGRNKTYIYQFDSKAGTGKMFNFWELFSP